MDRRTSNQIAANIGAAIANAGESLPSVSEATGIPAADLTLRPEELTVDALRSVGGFLHVNPSVLLEGVAA